MKELGTPSGWAQQPDRRKHDSRSNIIRLAVRRDGVKFWDAYGGVDVGTTWCVRLHDGWLECSRGSKYLGAPNRFLFSSRFSLINELRRGLGFLTNSEAHTILHTFTPAI